MWDENKPVQMMKALWFDSFTMQHVIDAEKYIEGDKLGRDLCGSFAPFCKVCAKWAKNPCVTAYRINERMNVVCPMLDAACADDPAVVQAIVDMDKYLASQSLGVDLCGRYAPFCAVCDKEDDLPCGQAYLKYKAIEGFSTKALTSQTGGELVISMPRWDDALTQALEETVAETSGEVAAAKEQPAEVSAAEAVSAEVPAEMPAEEPAEKPVRRGFRIGIARRRVKAVEESAEKPEVKAEEQTTEGAAGTAEEEKAEEGAEVKAEEEIAVTADMPETEEKIEVSDAADTAEDKSEISEN